MNGRMANVENNMTGRLAAAAMAALLCQAAAANDVRGVIKDAETGEEIMGAMVTLKDDPMQKAVTGLDGSFRISATSARSTIICSCLGYHTGEVTVGDAGNVSVALRPAEVMLGEVNVIVRNPGRTEAGARLIERNAMNVVNVMSAKAMELSPDVTVAGVLQRMSGVAVERNSSGEGQYAILRGMDKRYNYTLVNGVKIPSPDNKNRFVPLDMFPCEMLDRLEVSKSLTAGMEGDGIGGAVNMVMKDAPNERQVTASLSSGFNAMYFGRDFKTFGASAINRKSPYEAYGKPENYSVGKEDFTTSNLDIDKYRCRPDLNASLSYGDRFLERRLGVMFAAGYRHENRGKEGEVYYLPGSSVSGVQERTYSTALTNAGGHLKLDYRLAANHKLSWYNGYMVMQETQVREVADEKSGSLREKFTDQRIYNSTVMGEHRFLGGNALSVNWKGVYSKAYSETPDQAQFNMTGNHVANTGSATRRWEHNSDRDWAGYMDIAYKMDGWNFSAGGMYRDKRRESFFNEYTFDSTTGTARPQYRHEDWRNYSEIQLKPRMYGNIGDPLNYDALEQVGALYGMAKYTIGRWNVTAGVRAEHTRQGYTLLFPRDVDAEGEQRYWDVLPSAHVKYAVHKNGTLHLSYNRSLNRPGFFEIVPYSIINEDYKEKGNPALEHCVADNVDLRYEFFPKGCEQIMAGLFYKHLRNPIEYGLVSEGQDTYFKPMNFGNATNMGFEIDAMKYFSWFGVKANYTYTHSSITTNKREMQGSEVVTKSQNRPLCGQAAHVANVSLLFKDTRHGWEGQIAYCYTGKRLSEVSSWYDDDIWEDGCHQLDASVEKTFGKLHLTVFAKAKNLFDTPVVRFVNQGSHTANVDSLRDNDGNVVERKEWRGQSFSLGVRWRL